MKLKNISILALGVSLVYCGVNFQPVRAGIDGSSKTDRTFSKKPGDKFKISRRHEDNLAKKNTFQEIRSNLEANIEKELTPNIKNKN